MERFVGKRFEKSKFQYEILDYNEKYKIFIISKMDKDTKQKTFISIKQRELSYLMSQEN
jgi:hypothetical protein